MAQIHSRPLVELGLITSLIFVGLSCGSRPAKNPAPPPKESSLAGVEEIAPSLEPSTLQKWLAGLTPARAKSPGAIHQRLDHAVDSFLQRIHTTRLYLAVDKPLYQPGETIWLRTWELGTPDLLPATATGQAMTLELVSPRGAVVGSRRVLIADGVARSDFPLPAGLPGGEYILRATSATGSQLDRTVMVSAYQPPRIKKSLEFIRKAYGPGDQVAAALALHRATGEPLESQTVTAIASVDGLEVARVPITTSADGTALIKFALPGQIARGDGLLTVLVEDGGVVESIQKRIPITLKQIQLSLYPEGGDLIAGLPGRVYFSARNLIDKPADVQGQVLDDRGAVVAEFASLHDGLGRFEIVPTRGHSYTVRITRPIGIEQSFPLPEAREDGCALQSIDDFDSERLAPPAAGQDHPPSPRDRHDEIRVAVWCTSSRTVIATATLRERKLGTQSFAVERGDRPTVVGLAAARWDQGAVRVTLFSDRGAPLAERLVYRGRGADMKIAVEPIGDGHAPRDRVELSITTTDLDGQPVAADLAVAVVDDTVLSFADDKTANILAKLYLEHEMPGQKIEEPNFYFSDAPEAAAALDLLLGTQGWRRFEWQLILSPEAGADTTGSWNAAEGFHAALDAIAPVRQARGKLAPRDRRLRVLRRGTGPAAAPDQPIASVRPLLAQAADSGWLEGTVADHDRKPLAGVAVSASSAGGGGGSTVTGGNGRYRLAGLPPGQYVVSFVYQGLAVSYPASVRLGRATLVNARLDTRQIVKSTPSDDEPMAIPEAATAAEPAPAAVAPPRERRAAGAGGMAARRPAPPPPPPPLADPMGPMVQRDRNAVGLEANLDGDLAEVPVGGVLEWAPVREFPMPHYQPGYDGPRNDFRETILWAPQVRTGDDGKATVELYLSDAVTSFRAVVEGVSAAGRPGHGESLVKSSLPISLDAKLPLEVSSGDRIELPITLSNETSRSYTAEVGARFGAAFKVSGGPPRRLTLAAGARQSFFYQLEVVGDGRRTEDGKIALWVDAAHLKDQVEKTIDVVPLGFPQEVSLAGTVADVARHEVDLHGALPGTIEASLTMYPSPLATMTKGTEAILREPGGCFEQASSSNYPNVMVLSYLERHDAADPELVARTQGMLERGYRMLTGYESPQKGYEWFGGDPGHEALTAYGLMEFADMVKVYDDTDRAMIARTAAWLKQRRDGKGGYQRNSRALDSFGSASPEVTNGYITWALSETGATDLGVELDYQRKVATTTSDPYLLALAAGAMVNLDPDGATTRAAIERLVALVGNDGRFAGADHSITRSGGQALDIETTSLAVLALLAAAPDQPDRVRTSIEWLDQQRSGFGGYGSTQSTILALKALTRYAEVTQTTRSAGTATLYLNGKRIKDVEYGAGHKDALDFGDVSSGLRPGKNQIELRLSSAPGLEPRRDPGAGEAKASPDPLPYSMAITYRTRMPQTSAEAKVAVATRLDQARVKWGEGVNLHVDLRNLDHQGIPMVLARIGLPGGLTFQTWQLKELKDKGLIDFFETRDREVILYLRSMAPDAEKSLDLSLLAAVPGDFIAPASSAYLYYTDEFKQWAEPVRVEVVRE